MFKTRSSIYSGRVTCVICFESCLKKNSKRCNFETIRKKDNFRTFAERWTKYDHEFNKVFSLVDWDSEKDLMAHKSCKGTFMKESFMISQKEISSEPLDQPNTMDSAAGCSNENKLEEQDIRRSTRQSCSYISTKDENNNLPEFAVFRGRKERMRLKSVHLDASAPFLEEERSGCV